MSIPSPAQAAPVSSSSPYTPIAANNSSKANSSAQSADTYSTNNPPTSKKTGEKPFAVSLGTTLAEVSVGWGAYSLGKKMSHGKTWAGVIGFLLGGAVTGGGISALWQKRTTGVVDKQRLGMDALKGSVGF